MAEFIHADSLAFVSIDGLYRAVGEDGRVAPEPLQVIPVGRNAHSIRTDESNRFAFVPTLGSNEIFEFTFDSKTGRLASNTPAVLLMKPALGPRHFITSRGLGLPLNRDRNALPRFMAPTLHRDH